MRKQRIFWSLYAHFSANWNESLNFIERFEQNVQLKQEIVLEHARKFQI